MALIKDNETNNKTVGKICLALGGFFALAGVVFFILSNYDNLFYSKVTANVLSRVETFTEDGAQMTTLSLGYPVAGEYCMADFIYDGVFPSDQFEYEVYYDSRNPSMIAEINWLWAPLFVFLAGGIIFLIGLYLTKPELAIFGRFGRVKDMTDSEEGKLTESVSSAFFPLLGSVLFMIFGIVMLIIYKSWWTWIFLVVGLAVSLTFLFEFIPALNVYLSRRQIEKARDHENKKKLSAKKASKKVKVVVVDDKIPGLDDIENEIADEKSEK